MIYLCEFAFPSVDHMVPVLNYYFTYWRVIQEMADNIIVNIVTATAGIMPP